MRNDTRSYMVGEKVYVFDIIEDVNTLRGKMYLGECRSNGRTAWLDESGFQFMGQRRVPAKLITNQSQSNPLGYGYTIWGGQIRDTLPHGRRWYMNGGRW